MKKVLLVFIGFIMSGLATMAQSGFDAKVFSYKGSSMPYRILLPLHYKAGFKYPVIIFLHGSGERGDDNESQLVHGSKFFLDAENRKNFPAIVIFPQCPANDSWSTMLTHNKISRSFSNQREPTNAMKMLLRLIKNIEKNYAVKKDQVYIGGLSMGGMGTFEIAGREPKLFAAAFPICGGGDTSNAPRMKKIAWWVFHGDKDNVVLPEYSEQMVDALKKAGAEVRFTLYPGVNHNSWDSAFAEPDLLPWLFSHKKSK
jgi:predicted peptidase